MSARPSVAFSVDRPLQMDTANASMASPMAMTIICTSTLPCFWRIKKTYLPCGRVILAVSCKTGTEARLLCRLHSAAPRRRLLPSSFASLYHGRFCLSTKTLQDSRLFFVSGRKSKLSGAWETGLERGHLSCGFLRWKMEKLLRKRKFCRLLMLTEGIPYAILHSIL